MDGTADESLLAAARQIAMTLGKDESATGDILQILSGYDSRLRTDARPRNRATLESSLDSLERLISGYIATDHPIWSDHNDSSAFLDAIDELIASSTEWKPLAGDKSVAICLSRADELIQQAMFRLQEEFGFVMDRAEELFNSEDEFTGEANDERSHRAGSNEVIVAQVVTDYKIVIEGLPSSVIGELNAIAKRMVAGSFGKECSRVYSCRRRDFLEESFSRLRLRRLSTEEVQEIVRTNPAIFVS